MTRSCKILTLGVLATLLILGLVEGQKRPSKPLPRPTPPPLLPPVPSEKLIDQLTRQQLAFIRNHQKLQQERESVYDPYSCLPKYICVVDDEYGNKRTTIVNGLHPTLREHAHPTDKETNKEMNPEDNEHYRPFKQRINVPHLTIPNPGDQNPDGYYGDRVVDDEFLRDQEVREKIAAERQQMHQDFTHDQKRPNNSGEESNEEDDDESNEDDNNNNNENKDKSSDDDDDDGSPEDEENDARTSMERGRRPPGGLKLQQQNKGSLEDAFGDADNLRDHVATIPWNDSPKNKTESKGGIGSMIKSVLPRIPFLSKRKDEKKSNQGPPTSSQRGILRRMLSAGSRPLFRGKRQAPQPMNGAIPFITKLGPGIKTSEQCRVLFNGCDLNYDEVMEIASKGQVLIEGDEPTTTGKPAPYVKLEDDEADQAVKEFLKKQYQKLNKYKPGQGFQKIKKPGKVSKYGNSQSPFNKDKKKPQPLRPIYQEGNLPVPSYPVVPMRFNFGKPKYYHGAPSFPDYYEEFDSRKPTTPSTPPPPTTTTLPPPVFAKNPTYKKVNRTTSTTNIVQLNSTHALQIIVPTSKPYRPMKAPVKDKNGRPVSFASVFTEVAGSSGGIHDFFSKVARVVGETPSKRVQKQIPPPPSPSAPQPNRQGRPPREEEISEEDEAQQDDDSDEEEEDEETADDESSKNKGNDDDELADDEPAPKPAKKKYTIRKKNKSNKNKKNDKNDKKKDEEEDEENEGVNDDETVEVDLPDSLPEHIKQGIIEDIKNPGKRQKEGQKEGNGGHQGGPPGGSQGGPPGRPQGGPPGRPQGGPPGVPQGGPHGGPPMRQRPGQPQQGPPPPHNQRPPQGYGRPDGPPGPGGPPYRPGPNGPPPPRGGGMLSSLFG